jgi:hypothetical protein
MADSTQAKKGRSRSREKKGTNDGRKLKMIAGAGEAGGGSDSEADTRTGLIDGEFRGDFTRDTFDPLKHYTRVLMQQGRVQLDADWNEQASILLHYLQALAADIIGPFGGPEKAYGFEILGGELNDFKIGPGRYYINGVLCENEKERNYRDQLSSVSKIPELPTGRSLVYLDAWERAINSIEDASIREVALNGPDTAVRAKTEWMVRVCEYLYDTDSDCDGFHNLIKSLIDLPSFFGRLRPEMNKDDRSSDICTINPDTKYRGVENLLYRVEIHKGGTAASGATFKWSRENGNIQFPILAMKNEEITLGNLGKDQSLSLKPGNYVEVIDDDYIKQGFGLEHLRKVLEDEFAENEYKIENSRILYEVEEVHGDQLTVTLKGTPSFTYDNTSLNHPVLRRWDQEKPDADDNCIRIVESDGVNEKYFDLENGIRIQFSAPPLKGDAKKSVYLPGNYWLLPARVATGAIDWPKLAEEYKPLSPHGIIHRYAPIGIIDVGSDGSVQVADCRCSFSSIAICNKGEPNGNPNHRA